jgi:uncharacterized membrane protein YadS
MAGDIDSRGLRLFRTEDYWAIWLGMSIIALSVAFFYAGSTLNPWAVTPGAWSEPGQLIRDMLKQWPAYLLIYAGFGAFFTLSMKLMGRSLSQFVLGYTVLFVGALLVLYLAGWTVMKRLDLGAPLLALIIGLIVGNLRAVPEWFKTALRTEYYIKTGIVLLGATLPLTLIASAGPIAFVQATIVSVVTWLTIYLAATRLFRLDPRFGAVLGTGGAVCGVSGSIAVGGAVKADKDHIAIGIAVVSVWALVMIFTLAFLTKLMIPSAPAGAAAGISVTAPAGEPASPASERRWYDLSPGEAGAWVGTSEYADAAGFAVVAELANRHGDAPIHAFTLMKVIGRDIWIGIWAFVLSIVSVTYWEKRGDRDGPRGRVGASVIWERFPKFVIGFFAASVITSLLSWSPPSDHVGRAPVAGTFKSQAQAHKYDADFSTYAVPQALAGKMAFDAERREITFRGEMSPGELRLLSAAADTEQRWALKELQFRSDWFASELEARMLGPIKTLRSWAFVLCFLCIGLSTRFKELATFGLRPFWAFTIGVLVNVPLGYFLTTRVFAEYWRGLP